jgi:hypothetical protein
MSGSTRWATGAFSKEHGYYIKYPTEYEKSSYYKKMYHNSGKNINEYYLSLI